MILRERTISQWNDLHLHIRISSETPGILAQYIHRSRFWPMLKRKRRYWGTQEALQWSPFPNSSLVILTQSSFRCMNQRSKIIASSRTLVLPKMHIETHIFVFGPQSRCCRYSRFSAIFVTLVSSKETFCKNLLRSCRNEVPNFELITYSFLLVSLLQFGIGAKKARKSFSRRGGEGNR